MRMTTTAVVVTNRPVLLERYALPGLVAVRRAGMETVILDQSDSGGAEELARGADIRWLRSTPPLARGRNEAVAVTSSEVIAFIDDDAEFDAGWAGRIADLFADHPEAGVVAGRAIDARGRRWPGAAAGLYGWPTNPFGLCSGFNLAFRRAALADAGPFDEALGAGAPFRSAEDTDMVYRVMRSGWQVLCSDDVTAVHHDWRSGSQQLRLHYGYGYGAGAQTAGHAAQGDREALRIARSEALKHVLTFFRAVLTLRLRVAAVQPPFLIGMWAGYRARKRVNMGPEDRVAPVNPELTTPIAVDAGGPPTSHSTLLAGGIWNTAARVIPQLYTLAILVVAAHYLGAAGLGHQSYIAFIELTVVMLVTGGLPTAVMRYVSESLGREEPAAARSLIRWAWGVELVAGAVGGGALVIAALLGASPTGAWTLAGVAAALGVFHSVPSALLLGAQRWRAASIAGLVIGSLGTGATIIVLAAGGGITGMFAVEAAVGLVTLAWTTLLARRVALELSPRIEPSPELRRLTLRYSLLGTVSVLLAFVIWRRSEFFFLKHYSTYTQIAVYSIPFSFVAALVWVFEAVVAVVTPVVATLHGAGAHERIRVGYGRVIRLFLLTSLPLAAVMMSIGPAVLSMLGSQFKGVGTVTLIMLVTFPFVPLAKAAGGLLHGLGLIRLVLISSVFAAGANLLLDFLIIPGNGAVGAAIANGGAQIIAAVPALFYSIRATGGIDWQARFLARGVCVSAVAGAITWGAVEVFESGPASVASGLVAALVAFATAARLFRLIPPDDAAWLQGIFGPRLHGVPALMIGWWTPHPALGSGRLS